MTPQLSPSDITVACHVRPALLLSPVDSKVETLRECDATGRIDELLLRSWPAEVTLDTDSPYHEVIDRHREFEVWAENHDVSLEPAFRVSTSSSLASDETVQTLVTPGICLALYHSGQLLGVTPFTDGETTCTVPDTIAALRTGTLPAPLESLDILDRRAPAASTPTAESGTPDSPGEVVTTACPTCDGEVANVQGLLACLECEWVRARMRQRITLS